MNKNFYFILWIGYIALDFTISVFVDQMHYNKHILAITPCLTAIVLCYAAIRKTTKKEDKKNTPPLYLDIILIILMILSTLLRFNVLW